VRTFVKLGMRVTNVASGLQRTPSSASNHWEGGTSLQRFLRRQEILPGTWILPATKVQALLRSSRTSSVKTKIPKMRPALTRWIQRACMRDCHSPGGRNTAGSRGMRWKCLWTAAQPGQSGNFFGGGGTKKSINMTVKGQAPMTKQTVRRRMNRYVVRVT
jgi:hypothetical protein